MRLALQHASAARARGEVPVGALLVRGDAVIAAAGNSPIASHDPTAHAEIEVLRAAGKLLGSYRLAGTTLYVTLEPCVMCAGAIVLSRLTRLVYGATDPKAGACSSLYQIVADPRLNHRVEVTAGVLAEPCGEILTEFFQERRKLRKLDAT